MKQCNKCKETKNKTEFHKAKSRYDGLQPRCKICSATYLQDRRKTKKGHLESCLNDARYRAKEKNLPFNIDINYMEIIATDSCPVFFTPFSWGRNNKGFSIENPSLDRIIPELGYVKGNVVFLSNLANTIKQTVTEKELYAVADWLHDARKKVLKNVKALSITQLPKPNHRVSKD